ncbi:solute carrier family 52, riboflavin transporter, member 3-B-like isoform X2 [Athalia rosae]|nr:solute carrier family 52, riboflavin transporter, member 3-B-like isoform X2 [Athalia rosae]XP_048508864.1 solute carrier family 52, riboflavin transporter, member 3-B-like isoform X2 [Athalia rosae]XP_048508865.1 solute carrier family 52, riboflavin transporter, member 3-B-like isoform X2 [Athalia rosae]XP_048508866.1 solute carrier family 52, riboflavin transporter, member 3-B-like isoform X2 [Athalia rosae]XP_048508867.1 solute carrier family 52, riboflavin transporter, member 3-B-like is
MYGMAGLLGDIGILVEVPLLVKSAPEGPNLPSYTAAVLAIANVAPIFYVLVKKFLPRYCNEFIWISTYLVIAIISIGILALFYDVSSTINGKQRSIVILIMVFICASIGNSSSVILLPYLQKYEPRYLPSFFLGESLGGLVPGMIALLQGVGSDSSCKDESANSTATDLPDDLTPNFPPGIHFLILFILLVSCTASFWLLEYARARNFFDTGDNLNGYGQVPLTEEFVGAHKPTNTDTGIDLNGRNEVETLSERRKKNRTRIYICTLVALTFFIGPGIVFGTQAFSCLPYGIAAYHLVLTLMQFAGPAAFVFGYCLSTPGVRGVTWIFALIFVLCAYIIWLAFSSPNPLWHDETRGAVLLVTAWVIAYALIGYIKLSIAAIGRRDLGEDALYHVGLSGRVGIVSGAFVSFVLINYTSVFTPYGNSCP